MAAIRRPSAEQRHNQPASRQPLSHMPRELFGVDVSNCVNPVPASQPNSSLNSQNVDQDSLLDIHYHLLKNAYQGRICFLSCMPSCSWSRLYATMGTVGPPMGCSNNVNKDQPMPRSSSQSPSYLQLSIKSIFLNCNTSNYFLSHINKS